MADQQYGLIAGKNISLPLESVSVRGHIKGYVVGLDTTLCYRSSSDDPLEVTFRFPVEEGMAVVGLEATINGRTIKGTVREKAEAKAMYDDAIASGTTAAYGEEMMSDIFSLSLGNLPPHEEAVLLLKLVGELAFETDTGAGRFTLPTVLKSRYTPTGSTDPLASVGGEPGQVKHGATSAADHFSLEVSEASAIASVTSPTNSINVTDEDDSLKVSLADTRSLANDVVILVHYKEPNTPRVTVEERQQSSNSFLSSTAVMLDFFPKFESLQANCEFVFVVDRSGSMAGQYISSACETMILFLTSIPPGCYFNIIGFGSSYSNLFPRSVPYNQTNLERALQHVRGVKADMGGTQLLEPLQFVFGQPLLPGLPRQVFVITDGAVSNTEACVTAVRDNAHVARVFTFGIGMGASSALVKGLAKAGNGSAEFVREGDRLQAKVISILKKALQPSVTDIQLTFSVPPGVTITRAPCKIPPIFNGDKLVLYGQLQGEGVGDCTAVLKGTILDSTIMHKIDFSIGEASGGSSTSVVHCLLAKSLLKDWENGYGQVSGDRKEAIVQLSCESGVVSCHTAYIAVVEGQKEPIEGALVVHDIQAQQADAMISLPTMSRYMSPAVAIGGRSLYTTQLGSAAAPPKSAACCGSGGGGGGRSSSSYVRLRDDDETNTVPVSNGLVSLSPLIMLQTAEGHWNLNSSFAVQLDLSLPIIRSSCPPNSTEEMWSTVLALIVLEHKYGDYGGEWELVAVKAETWLLGQLSSGDTTLEALKGLAKQFLKY